MFAPSQGPKRHKSIAVSLDFQSHSVGYDWKTREILIETNTEVCYGMILFHERIMIFLEV